MSGLPAAKIEIVRNLVQTAPDKVVGGLQAALATTADDDSALAGVRRLVEAEVADRRLRNTILSPVVPLFAADGRSQPGLCFPPRALSLIWRALKLEAPGQIQRAQQILLDYRPDETSPEPFDEIVRRAADGLRSAATREYQGVIECLESAAPGGASLLLSCLGLSPIIRTAAYRLPEWTARITGERAAAARVAYRDATALGDDAGPRFFEMLAAHMPQRWMVLRIISAVMDRPTEHYLAGSELAFFAERMMDAVDEQLRQVAKFDLDAGPKAGREAAALVEGLTQQIAELENGVELTPTGAWGGRIARQRKTLAATVEGRMREVEKVLAAALPGQPIKVGRAFKTVPRLTSEPDADAAQRAFCLLAFIEATRGGANYGGFASTRAKIIETVGETLDTYVEDVLHAIRAYEVEDRELAGRHLQVAARCAALIREPRAGDVIRRRTAAALAAEKVEDSDEMADRYI